MLGSGPGEHAARGMGSLMIMKNKIENAAERIQSQKFKVPESEMFPSAIFPDPAVLAKMDESGMLVETVTNPKTGEQTIKRKKLPYKTYPDGSFVIGALSDYTRFMFSIPFIGF